MAINTQKFLPSSKGGALSKVNNSIIKGSSSIGFTNKSVENLGIIRVKVIQIDDILKGTLAVQKKKLTDEKKKESSERREKIEEKLETKPNAEKGKIKMPSLPRMGFLDWVKNFIGNIILGYFAVRLVDHLPKIIPIVKFLGKATDFVLGVGGKLLDGLVTFIDWGYKAYDATRGFIKNLFGDDGAKQFDQLSGTLNQFLNLALIAGMAVAGSGGFGRGNGRNAGIRPGGKPKVTTSGGRTVGGPDVRNPFRQRPKVTVGRGGNRALLSSVRPFLKRIPLPVVGALIDFGLSVALGENPGRAAFRAIGAGLLGAVGAAAGTVVPVAGNFIGGLLGGAAGDAIGGVLYDFLFGGKTSSAKGKTTKKAGGGITRAGRPQRGVKRTLTRKGKYKRRLAPKKPGDVEATSPGSDVGGEQKLFGLFPNPFKMMQKAADVMNPFKVIQKAGHNLGESDYFGPILAITSKILLGQKPTQEDYKNVGLGINMLVAKGIDDGKLKGGLAAFAEGGFVDPKTLDAIAQNSDISDWVAKAFKESTETNAQKTLREIQENLRLRKPGGDEKTAPSAEDMGEGGGVQVSSDSEDFWLLATAAMFENSHPQGAADVAQVIYNRTQYPAWNAPTIKKAILNPGQFQPVRQYGGADAWSKIKTKQDAIRFSKTYGKTQEQLERVAAALLDADKQQSARQFVGARDSFRADAYERANNHLANETEKSRHGHTFGFEPGGAMIGQFKAGKLSAAQVNANIKGETTYSGDVGTGSGNWRFGLTGRTYMSQPNWSHAHFQSFDGSVDTLVRDGVPLIKKMAGSGLKPELSDGTPILANKNNDYYAKLIRKGQAMHTHSGRKSAFDVNMPGFPLVPFRLTNFQNDPGGGGNYATVPGSGKTVLMHMSSKLNGYEKGGFTKSYPHIAMIGEKGKEFVIDADSTVAIEGTFPGFLDAINKAKYKDAINVLRNFASYESGSDQIIIVADTQIIAGSDGAYDGGGGLMISSSESESDPFDSLYIGG